MINLTGYKLTFDEEFNSRSISKTGAGTKWADIRAEWKYDAHSDIGFGKSSFVDAASGYDPFRIANGALTITAVPDTTKYGFAGSWESGLIHTRASFSQTYGYFEMRADLSDAVGSWDAFWMLPITPGKSTSSAWKELDIVEHYGVNNNGVYSYIHTTDTSIAAKDLQVYSQNTPISAGYHTFGMDWNEKTISFYVDGILKGTRATPSDMHSDMYLLANLATQSDAKAPMSMSIDYIRAYSRNPSATAVLQDTISAPDGKDPGLYGAMAGQSFGEIFRFYNKQTGVHFYTNSTAERDTVLQFLPNFVFEGSAFKTPTAGAKDGVTDIYRFLDTSTGAHFYTADAGERDRLKTDVPSMTYEGAAFKAYTDGGTNGDHQAVFRFLRTDTGTHFYTSSDAERQNVVQTLSNYRYEGVAYYVEAA